MSVAKLATFIEGDTSDNTYGDTGSASDNTARFHLTQKSGELNGDDALFVGVAFGAPDTLSTATKVQVSVNGSSKGDFTLGENSVSGTGSDVLNNSFIQYLPFAKADGTQITDNTYVFEFTWLDDSGNVLGTSSCTISRVSA